jgi:hypothetical protein
MAHLGLALQRGQCLVLDAACQRGVPCEADALYRHTSLLRGVTIISARGYARRCPTSQVCGVGTRPSNKRMQLTKLRAAPERQDKVPPCAPAGRMDGGTASQLIRSVRRTVGLKEGR